MSKSNDSLVSIYEWYLEVRQNRINFLENQRKGPNVHGTKSEKRVDSFEGGTYMVYTFKYNCTRWASYLFIGQAEKITEATNSKLPELLSPYSFRFST